jgi:hypothetical protein
MSPWLFLMTLPELKAKEMTCCAAWTNHWALGSDLEVMGFPTLVGLIDRPRSHAALASTSKIWDCDLSSIFSWCRQSLPDPNTQGFSNATGISEALRHRPKRLNDLEG